MLVTLLGIVTRLKLGELSKHQTGISVIPSGRTTSSKPVRLNAPCSKIGAPKISKVLKPLHPLNASKPMLVTLLPITISFIDDLLLNQDNILAQLNSTFSRALQPENAPPPMLVTLLPIVTDVKDDLL